MTVVDYYKYSVLATASYVRMGGKPLDGVNFAREAALIQQGLGRLPTEQARFFFAPTAERPNPDGPWNVLSYYGNDIRQASDPIANADKSGFGATLFQRGGEKVLAMRGTEPSEEALLNVPILRGISGIDLLSADLAQIGLLGIALTQVVSMANYVMRLRAPIGTANVGQLKVEATLSQPDSGLFMTLPGTTAGLSTPVYIKFSAGQNADGLGEKIAAGETVKLTGHSLGGHLAVMAAKLFPGVFDPNVIVFNSAGYDPTTPNLLALIGRLFPIPGGINIGAPFKAAMSEELGNAVLSLNTAAHQRSGEALTKLGQLLGSLPAGELGSPIVTSVRSEDLDPVDDLSIVASASTGADKYTTIDLPTENNNHVIEPLMDALALQSAIAPMQTPVFGTNELVRVLQASSNDNTRSYEEFTEGLFRLFRKDQKFLGERDEILTSKEDGAGTTKGDITARDSFHDAVLQVQGSISSTPGLVLLSLADTPAETLRNSASDPDGVAYRYALQALNPFAVLGPSSLYEPHNPNGELDLYNTLARSGALTAQYITDRSTFLTWANLRNTSDNKGVVSTPSITGAQEFVDLPSSTTIQLVNSTIAQSGGSGLALASAQRFVFGGDAADRLDGKPNEDHLFGGAGTDYLLGGGGNDVLEGGRDLDLYRYGASQSLFGTLTTDGNDTIRDIDGLGVLRHVYTPFIGAAQSAVIADTSVSVDVSTWRSADGKFTYTRQGADLQVTINVNGGGSLLLKDFRDGDFGIYLWTARPEPVAGRTLQGDLRPQDADPSEPGDGGIRRELHRRDVQPQGADVRFPRRRQRFRPGDGPEPGPLELGGHQCADPVPPERFG